MGLKPSILTNDKRENYFVFNGRNRLVVTNFEVLNSEIKRFRSYLEILNVGIIIDESAKLKNPNSKLTQTFFELSSKFKRKIIMSGTPIANRPYDIWSQIYFLDKGKSLGSNFEEFKSNTDLSNKLSKDNNKACEFENVVSSIFSKISKFTVRETKNSETVVLLSDKKVDGHVDIDLDVEKLEGKLGTATCAEIKKYVANHNDGMKVSSLYISQVKDKLGFEKRKNYNVGSGESRVPICPPEKEEAILEAFKHFNLM